LHVLLIINGSVKYSPILRSLQILVTAYNNCTRGKRNISDFNLHIVKDDDYNNEISEVSEVSEVKTNIRQTHTSIYQLLAPVGGFDII
jgi:hypothetical protein